MNLCHYAKVIIARSTKDLSTIQWWNTKYKDNEVPVSSQQDLSSKTRHLLYETFMEKFPKMQIPFDKFKYQLPRIQKYLTNSKYWHNNNKEGEKTMFLQHYCLQNWDKLPNYFRNTHQLTNCNPCENSIGYAGLHQSASEKSTEITELSTQLIEKCAESNDLDKNLKNILTALEPVVEKKLKTNLKDAACQKYKLTEKQTSQEKHQAHVEILRENRDRMNQVLQENDDDVTDFLSSSKSLAQYNKERLDTFFISKSKARQNLEHRYEKEQNKQRKPKINIGKLSNSTFDKAKFLDHIRTLSTEKPVSWTALAKQFDVKTKNGTRPGNAGQVLFHFARQNNVDVFKFNKNRRVSGRDYLSRVRRSKHKLVKRLSIPTSRPVTRLKEIIKSKINSGNLYIGEKIAPKVIQSSQIDENGKMEVKEVTVYGRKIPLEKIIETMNKEQEDLGLFRENQNITRHLKIWHDHSDILNRTYFCIMISCLYDDNIYLTNEEYKKLHPDSKEINIQSIVETPKMYVFGQSKSSDLEQMSYTETRIEDLNSIETPSKTTNGIEIKDIIRIFTGDNPARQFEAGQQRGGNYRCICGVHVDQHKNLTSCFHQNQLSIEERLQIFKAGDIWKKFDHKKNINVFGNLKKEEIISELNCRGIEFEDDDKKKDLQKHLVETLHGIVRPPALLCTTLSNDYLPNYEISSCEPLHDITNVVQNLLTELPYHLDNDEAKREYSKFCSLLIEEKNQIKGSDARLYAIKLALFTQTKYDEGLVNADIKYMCYALVNIIHLCYSPYHTRSPKNVLRMYNQCFLFGLLVIHYICNPAKLTSGKFYGSHFHSLVVHFPEMYRRFCLRSLIPEDEERTFGSLRLLAERTSNRHAPRVVDDCMLRYMAKEKKLERAESFDRQENVISKQANLLPLMYGTNIPESFVSRYSLWEAHCERIADFLIDGEHIWWFRDGEGNIRFFDGPEDEVEEGCNPSLHHFRSYSLQEEKSYLEDMWKHCIEQLESKKILLPLKKIKLYSKGKLSRVINTGFSVIVKTNEPEEEESYDQPEESNDQPDEEDKKLNTAPNKATEEENNSDRPRDTNAIENIEPMGATEEEDNRDHPRGGMQNEDPTEEEKDQPEEEEKENLDPNRGHQPLDKLDLRRNPTANGNRNKKMYSQSPLKTSVRKRLFQDRSLVPTSNQPAKKKQRSSTKEMQHRLTELEKLELLLGDTSELSSFIKAKEKFDRCPSARSFQSEKERCFAVIQTRVLKKHSEEIERLKHSPNNKKHHQNKRLAEKLMDSWKFYYYQED